MGLRAPGADLQPDPTDVTGADYSIVYEFNVEYGDIPINLYQRTFPSGFIPALTNELTAKYLHSWIVASRTHRSHQQQLGDK